MLPTLKNTTMRQARGFGWLPTRHESDIYTRYVFMIQYLPIYLTDSARNWLNNLREGTIKRWVDLEKAFCNHFEGAYTKSSTSWDLLGCKHKTSESLRDYIKCFTQRKNKIEDAPDVSIVTAFTASVDREPLIQDIGRRKNISLRDMFTLAHEHADGKD
jgi:hypothetical protein